MIYSLKTNNDYYNKIKIYSNFIIFMLLFYCFYDVNLFLCCLKLKIASNAEIIDNSIANEKLMFLFFEG